MDTGGAKYRILLMVGASRSGSTILGNSLGSVKSCIHVGEVQGIWYRGLVLDWLCGCGVPVRRCDFWAAVVRRAFGKFGTYDAAQTELWKLGLYDAMQDGSLEKAASLRERYLVRLRSLYEAVARESGCPVIVDSSKRIAPARLLACLDGPLVYYLHLVRDPRGYFLSYKTRVVRDDTPVRVVMHRTDPVKEARGWNQQNLAAENCCRQGPSLRVFYEEFARYPAEVLERILSFAGVEGERPRILEGPSLDLPVGHNIAGNPKKFQ